MRPLVLVALLLSAKVVDGVDVPQALGGLQLNGTGVREKFFMHFYVAGLYTQAKAASWQDVVSKDAPWAMRIELVRDVSQETFAKAVREGVEKNAGPALPRVLPQIEKMFAGVPELKKGQIITFTYAPGTGTTMDAPGKKTVVPGKEFADVILAVWIGAHPVQPDLKQGLLGG